MDVTSDKWFVVVNDLVGGWAIATADKPMSELEFGDSGEQCIADFWRKEVAEYVVRLHNESL